MWLNFLILCCFYWKECEASLTAPERDTPVNDYPSFNLTKSEMNGTYISPSEGFLPGAFSGFTVIAISEIGDKTFFIAVVLSLANSPAFVFGGALAALALMTALSASLGLVFSFLSSMWVHFLSSALFLIFGLKMLRESCLMSKNAAKEELDEVQKEVESKMSGKGKDLESGSLMRMSARWVCLEAFTMTFLSEWGDRSQIATVILAAKHNVFGVVIGAVLGHAACTFAAVAGGRFIADWISVKTVTLMGGILFLAFAFSSLIGALNESFTAYG